MISINFIDFRYFVLYSTTVNNINFICPIIVIHGILRIIKQRMYDNYTPNSNFIACI